MGSSPALIDVLGSLLPGDHAQQVTLRQMFAEWAAGRPAMRVLDLGCGNGQILDFFATLDNEIEYHGVDIEDSPEVRTRSRTDAEFVTFDGVHLPFPDDHFDAVYSHQVLEHVRFPEQLLPEVTRVLKPAGVFLASASFLEPYHSFSIFNYSPYGIVTILRSAGMEPKWLRPGIDGVTITLRRAFGRRAVFNQWFAKPSPLNRFLDFRARRKGLSAQLLNAMKLEVCGQIIFGAQKPG